MKRRILIAAILLLAITLTACGESRPYTWAIIVIDGRTIAEGRIDRWNANRDTIAVEIDGKRYFTAYKNVVLMETQPTTNDQTRACGARRNDI